MADRSYDSEPERGYGVSRYGPPSAQAEGPIEIPEDANPHKRLRKLHESQTEGSTEVTEVLAGFELEAGSNENIKRKAEEIAAYPDSGEEGDSESDPYADSRAQEEQKRIAKGKRASRNRQ